MEEAGKSNLLTISREDLDLLINSHVQKALQQQQQQLQAHTGATLPTAHHPVISTTEHRKGKEMEGEEPLYFPPAIVSPTRRPRAFLRTPLDPGVRGLCSKSPLVRRWTERSVRLK